MAQTAAAIRRKGALAGASMLVLVFFPAVEASKFGVLAPYAVLLLGCTTVLLSPAHRAVADLARRPAGDAQEIFGTPPTAARAATELRWAGFTCILFYAVYAAGDMRARAAAAAKEMSVERVCGLLLFLVFLVGVWTVSLSMLTGRGARPAAAEEEELDGGEVSGMVAGVGHAVASKPFLDGFVNKKASGGVTVLHLAALHGHVKCVHLLIGEHASLAAQTLPAVVSPMVSIGAGSTPLHYAACGGEVKCCQILVSRGADRTSVNCNGWLPLDVARIWGCNWLEHVLSPKSLLPITKFPPSSYLSLPLTSLLNSTREYGLSSSLDYCDGNEGDACAVCLERPCNVAAEVCGHELCVKCALDQADGRDAQVHARTRPGAGAGAGPPSAAVGGRP